MGAESKDPAASSPAAWPTFANRLQYPVLPFFPRRAEETAFCSKFLGRWSLNEKLETTDHDGTCAGAILLHCAKEPADIRPHVRPASLLTLPPQAGMHGRGLLGFPLGP